MSDSLRTASVRTAAATEKSAQVHAERAINDPAKLAKAARIVRTALARNRLTLADIVPGADR